MTLGERTDFSAALSYYTSHITPTVATLDFAAFDRRLWRMTWTTRPPARLPVRCKLRSFSFVCFPDFCVSPPTPNNNKYRYQVILYKYYGGQTIVIRTHDEPKNHVFPYVYAPYLVLIIIVCSPVNRTLTPHNSV